MSSSDVLTTYILPLLLDSFTKMIPVLAAFAAMLFILGSVYHITWGLVDN
jgi:hypothetical protein